jgi:hypothetical protein
MQVQRQASHALGQGIEEELTEERGVVNSFVQKWKELLDHLNMENYHRLSLRSFRRMTVL